MRVKRNYAKRRRASSSLTPVIRTIFVRDAPPDTTSSAEYGTPTCFAISRHTASFACPSTGAARTRTRSTPSCHPITSSRPDLGVTRTLITQLFMTAIYAGHL